MKITYDKHYGEDADGNRGITVIDDIKLDEEDFDDVKQAIYENFEGENYNDYMNISLQVLAEDYEDFEVLISEYYTPEEFKQLEIELND